MLKIGDKIKITSNICMINGILKNNMRYHSFKLGEVAIIEEIIMRNYDGSPIHLMASNNKDSVQYLHDYHFKSQIKLKLYNYEK